MIEGNSAILTCNDVYGQSDIVICHLLKNSRCTEISAYLGCPYFETRIF
jgi:hypothetical protein